MPETKPDTSPGGGNNDPFRTRLGGVVTVRGLLASHIEAIVRIERQSHAIPWSAQSYITELSNVNALYRVALWQDRVIGYGGLWVVMDEAHFTTIAVDPTMRGQGIGERVLWELLHAAHERGATRATLEVRRGNVAAIGLYEKYGFTEAGVRKGYYQNNHEDALILWLNDMDGAAWQERFAQLRAAIG